VIFKDSFAATFNMMDVLYLLPLIVIDNGEYYRALGEDELT